MFDWQELEEAQQEVEEKMSKKLQMPPVMAERDAASKVISWSWMRQSSKTIFGLKSWIIHGGLMSYQLPTNQSAGARDRRHAARPRHM